MENNFQFQPYTPKKVEKTKEEIAPPVVQPKQKLISIPRRPPSRSSSTRSRTSSLADQVIHPTVPDVLNSNTISFERKNSFADSNKSLTNHSTTGDGSLTGDSGIGETQIQNDFEVDFESAFQAGSTGSTRARTGSTSGQTINTPFGPAPLTVTQPIPSHQPDPTMMTSSMQFQQAPISSHFQQVQQLQQQQLLQQQQQMQQQQLHQKQLQHQQLQRQQLQQQQLQATQQLANMNLYPRIGFSFVDSLTCPPIWSPGFFGKLKNSPQIASFQNYPNQPVQSVGGYPNPTSIYPNGQTQQPTNPNLISNQTQNLQNSQKSNSDRYAALAELDTEIKQNQIQRKQIIKFSKHLCL